MKLSRILLLGVIFLAACAPVIPIPFNSPQASPTATTEISVLIWERTGGFAGFCDKVIVYESGSADVINCKGDQQMRIQLTNTQREELDHWLKTYKVIDFEQKDPAVADAMSIRLFLASGGTQEADEETINQIIKFVSNLAAQTKPPSP